MDKKDLQNLWTLIYNNSRKNKSLYDIIDIQKQCFSEDSSISKFFKEIQKETTIDNYSLKNLSTYVKLIKNSFSNSFEYSGGKSFRFYHSLNVLHLAEIICDSLSLKGIDKNICLVSSLFHDIGKSLEIYNKKLGEDFDIFEKTNNLIAHEKLGAEMTTNFIKGNFDKNFVFNVEQAINGFDIKNIYYKVVNDADNIAEVGNIGIFRLFYYNSCMDRTLEGATNYWLSSSYHKKIAKAKMMNFNVSKDLMLNRIQNMKKILELSSF